MEVGDRAGEEKAYQNLPYAFQSLNDFRNAIKYHEKHLEIAIEAGHRVGEGNAYGSLGNAYQSLGDFRKAIEYHQKHLEIAKEVSDRVAEGSGYGNLGNAYQSLGDFRKAIEYHAKYLEIAIEVGDRVGEGDAYGGLGIAYHSLGDFRKTIKYHEKHLEIAKEVSDRVGEGNAYGNLGNAYDSLGDFRKAIEYLEKSLEIEKEVSDPVGEGSAYGNLGNVYYSLGDLRKAIKYHEKHLEIAKEMSDRVGEGSAYGNLGIAYHSLGDFRKAIQYHEKHLEIAKEVSDPVGEGSAYGSLGNTYMSLGDFRKAIEYQEKRLEIAIEVGHRVGEGNAYGNLGNTYQSLGDFRKAIEYQEKRLEIAIEVGHRVGEGNAYGNLGNTYQSLGDFRKAIEYHEKRLEIAIEVGHRVGEGNAYGSLGNTYMSLGDFRKAIEYHENCLEIAKEVSGRVGEGSAYGNLGNAYQSLGDFRKAIEYHEKHLEIAIEVGHRVGEGNAYGSLGTAYHSLGDFGKAIEYREKHLEIAIEVGHRAGEGMSHHNIGHGYFSLGQFENAWDKFVSAVKVFNTLRSFLKSEDDWKINFRELHDKSYCAMWRSLLRIGKIDEALFAADEGRAQTLADKLWIQYKLALPSSDFTDDSKERISRFLTELSIPIIFLATEGLAINIWFLSRGKEIAFRKQRIEASITGKDPIRVLLEAILEKIRPGNAAETCEDRTFGRELYNEFPSSGEVCGEEVGNPPLPPSNNAFKPFYDAVIGPIEDLLGPEDDELVIVSDGALSFIPWAAVIESIKIRIVPSLKSYQLISSVPEGYHKKTGALLVGNPCTKELKKPLGPLPFAQKEVEMIAAILKNTPLVGKQATKAEVMKRMSSVGLIHIAAHGNEVTGQIVLSPNPGWTQFPKEEDYILKMSDVQAANLRARLVVLSSCHSGRGRISKGEGVVGIARAFLAAGARSVLVALWAIDDEATMEFMKRFYQHLKEGKTASAAVHQSIKSLRESEEFSEMWDWAPFQLIGDDVKIEFDAKDDLSE
ncbi:tetratricopeptide repeat protein 28-like [Acropora muricata]|uniref:tetratricopeptide repeat protein 28-like n=1 Tax=Acropora muricata TaxID=159855 RepID=UPI0034E465AC